MALVKVETLIEAGVHFGHRVSRWHPLMRPYIFGKRNQIHIIDIRHTIKGLVRACNFLTQLSRTGKEVVFVGTKRQAKSLVQSEAERCGMHYVSQRWLGGTLTNHHTILSRLKRLEELEHIEKSGDIDNYSKKRVSALRRERKKISTNLEGIRRMRNHPGCLVVVDVRREKNAVQEARKMKIPIVGLVDTDCNPRDVDIVIPCNDDAYRSIQAVLQVLTDAVIAGRDKYVSDQAELAKAKMEEKAAAEAAAQKAEAEKKAAVKAAAEKAAAEKAAAEKAAGATKPKASAAEPEKPAAPAVETKPEPGAEGGEAKTD